MTNKQKIIKPFFDIDYYDYPRSGVCEYNGEKYYFWNVRDENDPNHPATKLIEKNASLEEWGAYYDECNSEEESEDWVIITYNLYKLTPVQLFALESFHRLFEACVGKHSSYTPEFVDFRGSCETLNSLFYEEGKKIIPVPDREDIMKNECIGEFDYQEFDWNWGKRIIENRKKENEKIENKR